MSVPSAKLRKTLRNTYAAYHDGGAGLSDRNQPEALRKLRNIAERTFRGSVLGSKAGSRPSSTALDYMVSWRDAL